MGNKPEKHLTIERKDVNGPYSPENCEWATSQQQRWNRRNTAYVTIEGVTYKAIELSVKYGVHRNVIYERVTRGLPFQEVVTPGRIKWGGNFTKREPRTHCMKGHEYTAENIVWKDAAKTQRGCRMCHNAGIRRRHGLGEFRGNNE